VLTRSEIYNPRNALASASLPDLKYKFPKWNYKIHKKEIYISNMNFINPEYNFNNKTRKIKTRAIHNSK
jgi:hypothetical protein